MLFGKKEVTPDMILGALRQVQEPELHKDLVTLNMVKDIQVHEGDVTFTVTLTPPPGHGPAPTVSAAGGPAHGQRGALAY